MPSKFINILLEIIMVRDISEFRYLCAHVCVCELECMREMKKSKWNMVWINKFPMYYWIYYTNEEKKICEIYPSVFNIMQDSKFHVMRVIYDFFSHKCQ